MAEVKSQAARVRYSPGVRIVRLAMASQGNGNVPDGDAAVIADSDIIRAEVTLVNSGASSYSITLNNWDDRFSVDPSYRNGAGAGGFASLSWPRYKYNDFSAFNFGTRIRIDMGYWPDMIKESNADPRWIPMIAGPITDIKFTFSAAEGARVTINGEDDLRLLKKKNEKVMPFKDKNEKYILDTTIERARFPWSPICPRLPQFFDGDAEGLCMEHAKGQSYLEFLQSIATKYDLEVFVKFSDSTSYDSAIEFHMETSRSRVPPGENLSGIYVLRHGENLLDFSPTIKAMDQYTAVELKGKHRLRHRAKAVVGTADEKTLSDELHTDTSRNDPPLVSAPALRAEIEGAIGNGESNAYFSDQISNTDEARIQALAETMLRTKAREFLTVSATTIGLPMLKPGMFAEIQNMRIPFDGFFYITEAVHTFSEGSGGGLRTRITARRPGMPRATGGIQ